MDIAYSCLLHVARNTLNTCNRPKRHRVIHPKLFVNHKQNGCLKDDQMWIVIPARSIVTKLLQA